MTERQYKHSGIWYKVFRRLIFWSALSLTIQFSFLYYADNLFNPNHIAPPSFSGETDLKLPADAQNVSISYDGKLVSYSTSSIITVIDRESGRSMYTIPLNGDGISFIRWLPDREKMIYAVYKDNAGETVDSLYVYDADSNQYKNIHRLTFKEKGNRIDDVNFSTLTNLIYFQVNQPRSPSLLYKVDILSKLSLVPSGGLGKIERIALLPGLDTLIVQSKTSGSIYTIKDGRPVRFISDPHLYLLGVDSDNNIYLGRGSDGGITAIYQSDLHGRMNIIQPLDKQVAPDDVTVGNKGLVCLANYPQAGDLVQISSDRTAKKSQYEGRIRVCGDFILTEGSDGLHITPLPRS